MIFHSNDKFVKICFFFARKGEIRCAQEVISEPQCAEKSTCFFQENTPNNDKSKADIKFICIL
jgi:hypothetical protein